MLVGMCGCTGARPTTSQSIVGVRWAVPCGAEEGGGGLVVVGVPGGQGNTRRPTGPSSRNAQTASNGVPAGEGKKHPDGTTRHTQRGERGCGEGGTGQTQELAPALTPRTGLERHGHTNRALHPPRQ